MKSKSPYIHTVTAKISEETKTMLDGMKYIHDKPMDEGSKSALIRQWIVEGVRKFYDELK